MSEDDVPQICCLYGEPDFLSNIFLTLGLGDLLSVELVSTEWRNFILEENIWRKKVKIIENTSNNCSNMEQLFAKKVYFKFSSVIISNKIGTFENNILVVHYEHYIKIYDKSVSISRFI